MHRPSCLVLNLLVSLSFALMPYSTLHAHVSDHEHTHMHGGHVHDFDFDSDHDAKPLDQVVKISVPATTPSPATWDWTDWLPILCVVALLALSLPFVTILLRPPSRDTEPIRRRSYHHPPLRGPPASVHAI